MLELKRHALPSYPHLTRISVWYCVAAFPSLQSRFAAYHLMPVFMEDDG